MKTHARLTLATIALCGLVAALTVHAQSLGVKAQIPFGFSAGKTAFAPGSFTIHHTTAARGVLVLRSDTRGAILMTQGNGPSTFQNRPRLVFHRYGNRYFLREIWFQESGRYDLPETREERDMAIDARKTASRVSAVTIDATTE